MRKRTSELSILLAALAILLLVAGCTAPAAPAAPAGGSGAAAPAAGAATGAPDKVVIWSPGDNGSVKDWNTDPILAEVEKATNTDLSSVSDSELLDCFSYTLFPNIFLFPGISLPMVYRFRPDPRDHRWTLYEVLFLRPVPLDGKRPYPAEPVRLADDQSFTEAEGMDPGFGAILDQDTDNLILQQEGLEASAKRGLTLGNYQEIRIRHFERAVDQYVGGKA